MIKPYSIQIDEFDYPLPDVRIAKYPVQARADSRLLIYRSGKIDNRIFKDVPAILEPEDQLYFNKTKVVQARLEFRKDTGARIEVFCLQPERPKDYQLAFSSQTPVEFICLVGNAKKWKEGLINLKCSGFTLNAMMTGKVEDKYIIRFSWDNPGISFAEVLEIAGSTPIPPYLGRIAEKSDVTSYQTVYAKEDGSVAAPTAGLHFTKKILSELRKKGVELCDLSLHVGAGTFIPVKSENAVQHSMHAERVIVSRTLLKSLLKVKRKIAVGTTTTRSLESIYWFGVKAIDQDKLLLENLFLDQWEPYELSENHKLEAAIRALLRLMENEGKESISFETRIMITPGYSFKVIDGLFTNFHQPKSTLLLLIAAITGENWKKIYDYALENNYRFLSYGDSSLMFL